MGCFPVLLLPLLSVLALILVVSAIPTHQKQIFAIAFLPHTLIASSLLVPRRVSFASYTVEVTALAVKHVSMQRVSEIWPALPPSTPSNVLLPMQRVVLMPLVATTTEVRLKTENSITSHQYSFRSFPLVLSVLDAKCKVKYVTKNIF